jgi:hypothetical protein
MKQRLPMLCVALLCASIAGAALAQQQPGAVPAAVPAPALPSKNAAQIEAGEPRADTSAAPAAPATSTANTPAGEARAAASAAPRSPGPGKGPKPADRVELDTTTITGNRELPKVMYVVPWKKSDIGDAVGKPMNSLLDEVLAPVDRDVFRREVGYYKALKADTPDNAMPAAAPAPKGEK